MNKRLALWVGQQLSATKYLATLLAGLGLLLLATAPTSSAASSTIQLKQLNDNRVEAVISGLKYPLAGVVHVITNHPTCDETAIRGSHLPDLDDRLDFHELMSEQYERSGDSQYRYYQGQAGDWADKNRQFEFLFPAFGGNEHGYVGDRNTQAAYPPGKYLCMQVTFHDNNQFLKDFKQITLLTVSDPIVEGSNYKFSASTSVHWSAKKAGNVFDFETCEADITASGQASTTFTLETTEADRYKHFCVVARNSNGIQAYKLIMVNPPKDEPDPPVTEPDPPEPQNFDLNLSQAEAGSKIAVTAEVAGNNDIKAEQWQYLIADSNKISITAAADCQKLFQNPGASRVLVKPRAMTKQTPNNTASTNVSTNRAGHWVCVKAQEPNGGVGFGYIALPDPQPPTTNEPPVTTTPPTTAPTVTRPIITSPGPTSEEPDPDQPPAEPDQPTDPAPADPDRPPVEDAAANIQPEPESATEPEPEIKPETGRNNWLLAVISAVIGAGLSLTIWLVLIRKHNRQNEDGSAEPPAGPQS